jgi:hypothetical protein
MTYRLITALVITALLLTGCGVVGNAARPTLTPVPSATPVPVATLTPLERCESLAALVSPVSQIIKTRVSPDTGRCEVETAPYPNVWIDLEFFLPAPATQALP